MSEPAPWARGGASFNMLPEGRVPSSAIGRGGASSRSHVITSADLESHLNKLILAARDFQPDVIVTEIRIDRIEDAWIEASNGTCIKEQCKCVRCVTLDILQITHVITKAYFEAALAKAVAHINRTIGGSNTWGLGTLEPGKSNFWLSGMLLLGGALTRQPIAVYQTKVNDSKFWVQQEMHVFRKDVDTTEPDNLFVLDDCSYSGTQLANLVNTLKAVLPKTTFHVCPLFATPHALTHLRSALPAGSVLDPIETTPTNDAMFSELGNHRYSSAKNFAELMKLYAGGSAWGDTKALEAAKTLTTLLPYYKIPDYFSCPEKAYLDYRLPSSANISEESVKKINAERFKAATDQKPKYKNITM